MIYCLIHIIGVPVDYQGFLFERVEPFCELADNFMKDQSRYNKKYGIDYYANAASFKKTGFYSIFLQVLLSLHFHDFACSEHDVTGLCIYFGCFNNGTMQLAKVWRRILLSKKYYTDLFWSENCNPDQAYQSLLGILFHADYELFKESGHHGDSKDKWTSLIGNSDAFRFQKDVAGCAKIHSKLPEIFKAIGTVIEFSRSPLLKLKEIHVCYIRHLSPLSGIGSIRLTQLLHCLCLSGLLPNQCMTGHASISITANPGKMLKNITICPVAGMVKKITKKGAQSTMS